MRRYLLSIWVAALLCLTAGAQVPSGFIAVSGNHVVDSTGVAISGAQLCGQLTAANGTGISTKLGVGGHTTQPPVCVGVTNGAFTINLPDTNLTAPQNACVAVTVTDNTSGNVLLGPGYECVQPTSATGSSWCSTTSGTTTCNFDYYQPNLPAQATVQYGPQGIQGLPGINGQVLFGDLETFLPASAMTYGICNAPTGGDTYNTVSAHTVGSPVTVPGSLASFQVDIASYTAGAQITGLVLNQSSTGVFQQVQRFTVNISGTGVQTFTNGVDFSGVAFSVGQVFAILSGPSWHFTNNQTAPFGYYFMGDPGTAPVTYTQDTNNRNAAFTVQAFQQVASQAYAASSSNTAAQAAIQAIDPATTTTIDTYDAGTAQGNSGSTFRTIVQGQASPVTGTITAVNASFTSVVSGGGTVIYFVANKTATNTFQIVSRATLTIPAAGTTALNPNLPIAIGQYAGYIVNGTASIGFGSGTSAVGSFYISSDPGSTAVAYTTGGGSSVGFTITYFPPVSSVTYVSPLKGTRFGVWGHSLTSPGYEYTGVTGTSFTYWQQYFASLTGQTWVFNDGCVGGGYYNMFHHYPGISLSNLTAPYVADNCYGQSGILPGTTDPAGNTLAQNLVNVDTLYIWYGDNDIGRKAVGSPGDTAAANTNYGDIDNDLAILFTVKPSLHVVLIDTPQANSATVGGYAGYVTQKAFEQTAGQQSGVPLIDALSLFGLNPLTWATWQNNDSGQYEHPTNAGWAHYVPILARAAAVE